MSEFGRGYAVCLRQFLWHEPRLGEYVRDYADLRATKPDPAYPDMWDEARAVELWANGAADHLFDLIRPRRWIDRAMWQAAVAMQGEMLDARLNYLGTRYTEAQMRGHLATSEALLADYARRADRPIPETFQAAWDLDVAAGLKPERGDSATCEGPIPARQRNRVASGG